MLNLTEKYRPKDWEEVKGQDQTIAALKEILAKAGKPLHFFSFLEKGSARVQNGKPPNMLFIGPSGTGKTTIARIFAKHYGSNVEEFNASDERGLEVVREKIKRLSNVNMSVLFYLNEADGITKDAQAALRSIIEKSANAVFIFDVNNESKIIDPIKSRCTEFRFKPLSFDDVITRLYEICEGEGVKVTSSKEEKEAFTQIYKKSHGDLRKAINELEKMITSNKELNVKTVLEPEGETSSEDFSKTREDKPDNHEERKTKHLEGWNVTQTELGETYSMEVEIKRHDSIAKGKMYTYGRIQLTVDPAWIGSKAKISVFKAKEG